MRVDSSLLAVLASGPGTVEFRSVAGSTGTTATQTVNIPTYSPGDTLLYCVAWQLTSRSLATPTGWTSAVAKVTLSYTDYDEFGIPYTTNYGAAQLFRRLVQPGDNYTTLSAVFGTTGSAAHVVAAFSGANQTTPIDTTNTQGSIFLNATSIPIGSMTTTQPDTLGVVFALTSSQAVTSWPAGYVLAGEAAGASNRVALATLAYAGAAGVKDPANATAAPMTSAGSILLALRT